MTDQHRATPEQWAKCEEDARLWSGAFNCILELRARIEALEAAQLEQAESHRFCTDGITLAKLATGTLTSAERAELGVVTRVQLEAAMLRSTSDARQAAMDELRAWRPLDIETTYGSEAAADAVQLLRSPMVVQGTFEHGGETYRFKAKPERESAMTELRAASPEAQPVGGVGREGDGPD
jgi:hypothetical protein